MAVLFNYKKIVTRIVNGTKNLSYVKMLAIITFNKLVSNYHFATGTALNIPATIIVREKSANHVQMILIVNGLRVIYKLARKLVLFKQMKNALHKIV